MKQEMNHGWMLIQWRKVLLGACVSIVMTIALIGGFASLMSREVIGVDWMPYMAIGVILLSSVIGAGITGASGHMINQIVVGFIYWVILLAINALVFGGDLNGMIPVLIAIMGGCLAAMLLLQQGRGRRKHARRRYRHR